MTVLEALQQAPLFKDFSEAGLQTFAQIAQGRLVPAGKPLFVEDTAGDSLFVVMAGSVRITQRTAGGERELATLGPGEHLGDVALLTKTVRLVSAVAATDCEILEVTRREFFKKAQEKPVTCLKLMAVIAGELARRVAENKDALRDLAARKGQ
jgi:CRP-like cAMP-binding protein